MRTALLCLAVVAAGGLAASEARAADRFFGFNSTTATTFTGTFLAPEGTETWGPNQVLNDKDHTWEYGERLPITHLQRGVYEVRTVDRAGHVCIKHGVDLTKENSFEIRDADLQACRR